MTGTQEIIGDLLLLTAESAPLHPKESAAHSLFNDLESELKVLRQRCLRSAHGYKIAVVGLGNVGKSTLINNLLAAKVAPVRNGPCTASIVEFKHDCLFRIEATQPGRLLPEFWNFNHAEELHDKLCELVDHASAGSKACSRLVVSLPAEILADGLILADTPGFGAAGDDGRQDDQTVKNFLRHDVAQVFWVVMADQGILSAERRVYEQLLASRCDDLVVTNSEDWNEHERQRWQRHFSPLFHRMPVIHFVAGKEAGKAKERGDIPAWEAAGMAAICERIKALSRWVDRVDAVTQALEPLGTAVTLRVAELGSLRSPLFRRTNGAYLSKKYGEENWFSPWRNLLAPAD